MMEGAGRRLDLSRAATLLLFIFLQCPRSCSSFSNAPVFHSWPTSTVWGRRLWAVSASPRYRFGMNDPTSIPRFRFLCERRTKKALSRAAGLGLVGPGQQAACRLLKSLRHS